jgi:hypothetical protein
MQIVPALIVAAISIFQAAAPPDTEVFVASLVVRGGHVEIGKPINISNNTGYDNQPSFAPDGKSVFFTSVRGGRKPSPTNSAATGSDVYRYDLANGRLSQITDTPEAEYSPTVTPDAAHISVIRVEGDNTQRLWRFTTAGADPRLVLTDVKPVGYHAWATGELLALFVLGMDGKPATLQVADVRTGKSEVVATGIGRSIQRMPGGGVSYVQRVTTQGQPTVLTVTALDAVARKTEPLVRVPTTSDDVNTAWTPDGLLLIPIDGQLYGWRKGDAAMTPVADLKALGLTSVTRLAVSPQGNWLALVAAKP